MTQPSSDVVELMQAVDDLRQSDERDYAYLYITKVLFEQTVGMDLEKLDKPDATREAYGRALQEDLAYSPAHTRLSYMALDAKDTTTALSEFDLAVQLRPEDAGVRYQYGFVLQLAAKLDDAAVQLAKAIELN